MVSKDAKDLLAISAGISLLIIAIFGGAALIMWVSSL